MGQLVVDVYDATGNRIGQPVKTTKTVTVKRLLDGAGTISLSYAGTDTRAVAMLEKERRVRIRYDDGRSVRQIGSGIIRKDDYSDSGGRTSVIYSGPDALDELKRRNTLTNLIYNNLNLNTVVDDLLSITSGWSANNSIVNPITGRYDANSILKALQGATDAIGVHFRLSDSLSQADIDAGIYNKIDVGAFGDSTGIVALNPAQMTPGMNNNDDIAIIDSIAITGDTSAVATRLYVLGAGQNLDTSLTLEKCTRSIANGDQYDVAVEIRNGRSHWYIENLTASAEYGLIEKFIRFREIAPLSASENDEIAAANALYDKALPALNRMAQAQIVYRLSLRKVKKTILPGQTIRLRYEDPIKRINGLTGTQAPREINADFIALSVTEKFSDGNHTVSLDISNVDANPKTLAQKIFDSIEDMKVYADQIQPSIVPYPYRETVSVDSAGATNAQSATIAFPIQNFAYRVDRVVMRIETDVFEAYSKGAEESGAHRHRMFRWVGYTGGSVSTTYNLAQYIVNAGPPFYGNLNIILPYMGATADSYTDGEDPGHTHPVTYGVYRDAAFPGNLTIRVNGTEITVDEFDLSSPVGTTASSYEATFDITDLIVNKAGGFQAVHDIEITCGDGRGRVKVSIDASIYMLPYRYNSN
jgi:hypothetical protein